LNPRITSWRDKRVWLVGASSGIGAAMAIELQRLGAKVALSARRAEALTALDRSATKGSVKPLVLPLDVTDPMACDLALKQIVAQWGGIDVVVWLAGTYSPMRAQQFDSALAVNVLRVNYEGLLYGLGFIIPAMRAQTSGTIALVSSVAGYGGLPKSIAYGPTKSAMINLAETLYMDLRPEGLGVVLISPGFVDTPLTKQNEFKMPALITTEQAALEILRGLEKGKFEIAFPKRFTNWLRFLRLMPYGIYFRIVSRFTGL
jgi:NADP-dependent 3-hydroxy acid dehydrogenase YdfG